MSEMDRISYWSNLSLETQQQLLERPKLQESAQQLEQVQAIFQNVDSKGDQALREYTQNWDDVQIADLKVPVEDLKTAFISLDDPFKSALAVAKRNIETFHQAQTTDALVVETQPGLICQRRTRPIQSVGLYIPGGTAPLVSTLLMTAIPAQIAGVPRIAICTPPGQNGVSPYILGAAYYLGLTEVYQVGGAQSIAALALGTESIPAVDKIFGPGNSWVTTAKTFASQSVAGVSIDMPAGPSEVLVIADASANPEWLALDVLSQAEHGEDSQSILLCTNEQLLKEAREKCYELAQSSSRWSYLKASLENTRWIYCDSLDQAMDISNAYAPEHLILNTESPEGLAEKVLRAGSVFMGAYTPESLGDYASGTNHVLPTGGYAKSVSGLSLGSFQNSITFQAASPKALQDIAPTVETLAKAEGLDFHEKAVSFRRRFLESKGAQPRV